MDLKSKIETEVIHKETFVISGKVLKLFKEWLKTTKLSKQKLKIMNYVNSYDFKSLDEISKKLRMSLPLLSYHVNGNARSEGLFDAEMIEKINLKGGTVGIRLNSFGKLILRECEKY